jgi:hypothetical protein
MTFPSTTIFSKVLSTLSAHSSTSHDPDLLLATDIEYEEKLFFDNKDLGTQPNETTNNSEWKEVTNPRKNKRKTPTPSPTLSPTMSPTLAPVIPNRRYDPLI